MAGALFRKLGWCLAVGLAIAGMPAAAQMTDGFNFLKAVKERDGTAATNFLSEPGSTLVNARDSASGETALHITVRRRDEVWTKFLLDRGGNPNLADKKGVTPLALASSMGFVEGAELLVKRGARIDVSNDAGETPLIMAVHQRDTGLIRVLLANGANPERPDNSGRSAREYARLMGVSSGVMAEFERADAERKSRPAQDTYGPGQ
jgi:ankyrin repeat protein